MPTHKRIMVIDDDQDFISYVHIVLEAGGYDVDTALSVADGLQKMRINPPDLVITDVMLSRVLNGWSIRQEIRNDSNLADAFMSKPIEPAALLQRVAELVKE
jgi:CheY-like chemotaxis protein